MRKLQRVLGVTDPATAFRLTRLGPGGPTGDVTLAVDLSGSTATQTVAAEGAIFGKGTVRLTKIDGFRMEAVPEGHIIMLHNRDVPGVVGRVGTILGEGGVNIANFSLARGGGDGAAAVIAVDSPPPSDVLDRLRKAPGVDEVRVVSW